MVTYLSDEPGCRDVKARESTMRTCYPPGHVAPHSLKSFVNLGAPSVIDVGQDLLNISAIAAGAPHQRC